MASTGAKSKPHLRGGRLAADAIASARAQHALSTLKAKGLVGTSGSTKVRARLDADLLAMARAKLGAKTDTELLTVALAMAAGGDDLVLARDGRYDSWSWRRSTFRCIRSIAQVGQQRSKVAAHVDHAGHG